MLVVTGPQLKPGPPTELGTRIQVQSPQNAVRALRLEWPRIFGWLPPWLE